MATLKIYKETALPAVLEPHAVYLVAPAGSSYVEMYVTNADASQARRIIDEADIQAMIDAAVAGITGGLTIVATLADRDALTTQPGMYVLVRDASADPTVTSGAASYAWDNANTTWVKLTEYESLDLTLDWASLTGKPASTPAAIDAAVGQSHTHANATELAAIGQDANGDLTYNGALPHTGWDSTGW